ncbi:hypothetical protein E8E11_000850 [Didymella keratinophila]|nr:hypothetical protein E8E11_000850 [Didymella keratinophila]
MTQAQKTIVMITGANSGIGFALAAELLSDPGKHVLLGSRSVEKGTIAIEDLKSRNLPGSVELLQIDVSDETSIVAAAKTVESIHGRLDALVNNAAIGYGDASDIMFNRLNAVFRTNAAGAYATVEAFEPLLRKSSSPHIINVTSGAGSLSRRLEANTPFYKVREPQYRVSKAAMNMIAACQMVDYQAEGWKVFLYCPGFCESNLGPQNKAGNGAKPASEGAKPMVDMLNGKRDDEAGRYLHYGGEYPCESVFSFINQTFGLLGLPVNEEPNAGSMRGLTVFPKTVERAENVREDAGRAYYWPVSNRPNPDISLESFVEKTI